MHLELQQGEQGGGGKKDPVRRKDSGSLQTHRNEPIPIRNEHELAHLFLSEFFRRQKSCSIPSLDFSAILKILATASCFPKNVKMQAARVEDKVRGPWNLAVFGNWTKQKTKAAFAELECLALLVPNNQKTLSRLHEDSAGKGELEFPERAFLKSVNKYRGSVLQVTSKESTKYLKRRYKDRSTGQETANIEELVLKDEAVFLRGVSGSGKSTVISRVLTEWAEGTLLKSVVCCLKISAGSKEETSLNELFCDQPEFPGAESFDQFEKLAFDGKLAIIFERVDNLGTVTKEDVKEASKASGQPELPISKRAACWGILTNRLLPGAKLLATVGSFFVQNEMSPNTTLLYDIEDLNNEDINNLVGMMEDDQNQHKMIEDRLYEFANLGNHHLLKTPMLAKSLINLIRERKIDDKISVFEVYLALLTKNLSFSARTRRALSNDHIVHFLRFLKLFQMQVTF